MLKSEEAEVDAFIDVLRTLPTALISDQLDRIPGSVGLLPYYTGGQLVGRALTVQTRPGDNLVLHEALEIVQTGEVIVVDGGGDLSRALAGEIVKSVAESRGAAGLVIDGAIRDSAAFVRGSFPCFARGVNHRGPYKAGPGRINVPIQIGGLVVQPGDIVVGDADGLVAFNPKDCGRVVAAALARAQREVDIFDEIKRGVYVGWRARQ